LVRKGERPAQATFTGRVHGYGGSRNYGWIINGQPEAKEMDAKEIETSRWGKRLERAIRRSHGRNEEENKRRGACQDRGI